MLMPASEPEEIEEIEEEMPPEDDLLEGAGDDPVSLLAQAIAEHGPDDAGKLIEWLQEYGYELTPSAEPEGFALGGEEDLDAAPEGGSEELLEDLGEEEPLEEEFDPGESLMDSRRSAASRAFSKHYGARK
tara:strand:- start:59 stop:451 length:393 start_codon:yes stop_codon:yes gene_type:complete